MELSDYFFKYVYQRQTEASAAASRTTKGDASHAVTQDRSGHAKKRPRTECISPLNPSPSCTSGQSSLEAQRERLQEELDNLNLPHDVAIVPATSCYTTACGMTATQTSSVAGAAPGSSGGAASKRPDPVAVLDAPSPLIATTTASLGPVPSLNEPDQSCQLEVVRKRLGDELENVLKADVGTAKNRSSTTVTSATTANSSYRQPTTASQSMEMRVPHDGVSGIRTDSGARQPDLTLMRPQRLVAPQGNMGNTTTPLLQRILKDWDSSFKAGTNPGSLQKQASSGGQGRPLLPLPANLHQVQAATVLSGARMQSSSPPSSTTREPSSFSSAARNTTLSPNDPCVTDEVANLCKYTCIGCTRKFASWRDLDTHSFEEHKMSPRNLVAGGRAQKEKWLDEMVYHRCRLPDCQNIVYCDLDDIELHATSHKLSLEEYSSIVVANGCPQDNRAPQQDILCSMNQPKRSWENSKCVGTFEWDGQTYAVDIKNYCKFMCKFCDQLFNWGMLRKHVKTVHTRQKIGPLGQECQEQSVKVRVNFVCPLPGCLKVLLADTTILIAHGHSFHHMSSAEYRDAVREARHHSAFQISR